MQSHFQGCPERGYDGAYHKMSLIHLQKVVEEFSARHNVRELDTMVQSDWTIRELSDKRLKNNDLVNETDGRIH